MQYLCPPVQVWNPAFDVTPSSMITGVITERGVIRQEQGRINVHAFMVAQGLLPAPENGHTGSRIVSPIPGFEVSRNWASCVWTTSAGMIVIRSFYRQIPKRVSCRHNLLGLQLPLQKMCMPRAGDPRERGLFLTDAQ